MELQPRVKYRRIVRGRMRVINAKDTRVLNDIDQNVAWVTPRQIEAARIAMQRYNKRRTYKLSLSEAFINHNIIDSAEPISDGYVRARIKQRSGVR